MSQEKKNVEQTPDTEPNSAEVYDSGIDPCVTASAAILDVYAKAFAPCKDEQQFIEIGCGPGGFTLKNVFPSLPPCRRLVAVDKSEDMVKLASEKYSHPKIEYLQLDILGDVDKFVKEQGQFQRLYSFQVLHWIRDQRLVMQNFEKLLAPGGECLLLFMRGLVFCELFEKMMRTPRWSKYSKVLQDNMPETWYIPDVVSLRAYASNLVVSSKLVPISCEVMTHYTPRGKTKQRAIELMLPFNPVHALVDEDEKQELVQITREFVDDMFAKHPDRNTDEERMGFVIHAFKPSN